MPEQERRKKNAKKSKKAGSEQENGWRIKRGGPKAETAFGIVNQRAWQKVQNLGQPKILPPMIKN